MNSPLARWRHRDNTSQVASEPAPDEAPPSPSADEAAEPTTPASQPRAVIAPPTGGPRTRFGAWLGRPMTSFHLIIAVAALLTTMGLIMVLSASGVRSYDDDGSAWV